MENYFRPKHLLVTFFSLIIHFSGFCKFQQVALRDSGLLHSLSQKKRKKQLILCPIKIWMVAQSVWIWLLAKESLAAAVAAALEEEKKVVTTEEVNVVIMEAIEETVEIAVVVETTVVDLKEDHLVVALLTEANLMIAKGVAAVAHTEMIESSFEKIFRFAEYDIV